MTEFTSKYAATKHGEFCRLKYDRRAIGWAI
jgi:hypothetical protein